MQGRIHDVYLVQMQHAQFIIQCLNPQVIKDPSAFETLINNVLAPASIAPQLLHWPATGQCVLQADSGSWVRRSFIVGQAMTTQLSLHSFETMASTLRHFHQSLAVADLEQSNFIGVNPWSGEATLAIEDLYNQSSGITSEERAVVNEWGSLVLIDFDTIGTGDPALDLGELLRAWLSADELVNEIDSGYLPVCDASCTKVIQALHTGYNDPTMTASRIHSAAVRCCLWQCERFLEDHFAGDAYYPVQARGDNLIRAKQQLDAVESDIPIQNRLIR